MQDDTVFNNRIAAYLGRNTTRDEREHILLDFEDAVADYLSPLWRKESNTILSRDGNVSSQRLDFSVYKSLNDLAVSAGEIQVGLIVAWYVVVFVYGYLAYINHRNAIYSHSLMVIFSIAAISLSTLSAIGLSAWMGLPATSLTNTVVPFVAMGIGTDDTFVLISTFMQCFDRSLDAESIVAKTTEAAGPMMLYTTATNMVAYGIASTLPVYIIQLFCYQMVLNIALNLIILLLLVIPFLRYDAQRILAGHRENCFPGDVNGDHKGKHEHWMNQFFERLYVDYLFTTPGKIISSVLFALMFGLLAWQGFAHTEVGLDLSTISPDGSVQKDFFNLDEHFFGSATGYFVIQSSRFESVEMQQFLFDSFGAFIESPWVDSVENLLRLVPTEIMYSVGNVSYPTEPSRYYEEIAFYLRVYGDIDLDRMVCINVVSGDLVSCLEMIQPQGSLPYDPNVRLYGMRIPFPLQGLISTNDIITSVKETHELLDAIVATYDSSDDPNFRCYVSLPPVLKYTKYILH